MRPSRQGLLLASAGLVVAMLPSLGVAGAWPATPILWAALAAIFSLDALLSTRPRRLGCAHSLPEALHAGEPGALSLEVALPAGRSVPCEIKVDLSDLIEACPAQPGRLGAAPASFAFELRPRRRGIASVEGAWVRYSSPMGLWSWTRFVPIEKDVRILPNTLLVRRAAIQFFGEREFRSGVKVERFRGSGSEFDSLKDFFVGEDHRAIDWKASARHRKLLARQFRAERNHQIVLAVDTGRLMAEPLEGLPRIDHALNAALVLAYVGLVTGDRIGLFTFDSRVRGTVGPLAGVAAMGLLTRAAGAVRYSSEETNFTLGLTELSQRVRRRSLVVIMTDFVDTVTAELMLENVERIGRRHVVIFVSIRDPLLGRVEGARPGSIDALSQALVAQTLLRERALVHRRLRSLGIHGMDLEPRRIGPEVIGRYLHIKRREMV